MKTLVVQAVVIGAIISTNVFAENKLPLYQCNNSIDTNKNSEAAHSCSGCTRLKDQTIELKVSPQGNFVMRVSYKNNVPTSSQTFQDCKVFDKSNWSCDFADKTKAQYTHSMSNGIYTFRFWDPSIIVMSYACAKE
jgi:hypothetical protein